MRGLIRYLVLLSAILPGTLFSQTGRIYGVVTDSLTRQRIPFANVIIVGTSRGAAGNEQGFYMIPGVPPGTYEVSASVVGYSRKPLEVKVDAEAVVELNFQLAPLAIESEEIVISGSRARELKETNTSVHLLDARELKLSPVAAQKDVLQSLRSLPGFVSTSDVSSKFFVRGGAGDQNLFLFDGIRIYSPFHAMGIFSVFDPDVVDNVEVYTGAFPAGLGGRLSSVVSMRSRDGRTDRISGEASANFLSAKVGLEGPVFEHSSWSLNARKSISTRTFGTILGQPIPVTFYDGTFKFSTKPGGTRKIDVTVLTSGDELHSPNADDPDYRWRNTGISASTSFLMNEKTFVVSQVFTGSYKAERDAKTSSRISPASTEVQEVVLRTNATVYSSPESRYYVGFEFGFPSLTYQFVSRFGESRRLKSTRFEGALWVGNQSTLGDVTIDAGLHTEIGALLSQGRPVQEIQPRVSLSYLMFGNWRIKGSLGRFTQRVLTATNEDDVISVFDGWIHVPSTLPSQQADHFVAGISGSFSEGLSLNVEGYYKRYGSLVVYNRDKVDPGSPDFVQGSGRSYGAEVMVRSKIDFIDLYGAYSLSFARITSGTFTFAPRYDRRHHVNLMGVVQPVRGLNVTLRWEYGSGFPFSRTIGYMNRLSFDHALPGEFEHENGAPYQMIGAKNGSRLPAYHRLDLGVVYSFSLLGARVTAGTDVLNLYDQKNLFYIDRATGQRVNMVPFYPSATISVKF